MSAFIGATIRVSLVIKFNKNCYRLCSVLEGKGGGKGSRFNAKINSFKNVDKIESLLQNLLE
jgi:alanyl-tRNA synthetase